MSCCPKLLASGRRTSPVSLVRRRGVRRSGSACRSGCMPSPVVWQGAALSTKGAWERCILAMAWAPICQPDQDVLRCAAGSNFPVDIEWRGILRARLGSSGMNQRGAWISHKSAARSAKTIRAATLRRHSRVARRLHASPGGAGIAGLVLRSTWQLPRSCAALPWRGTHRCSIVAPSTVAPGPQLLPFGSERLVAQPQTSSW